MFWGGLSKAPIGNAEERSKIHLQRCQIAHTSAAKMSLPLFKQNIPKKPKPRGKCHHSYTDYLQIAQ